MLFLAAKNEIYLTLLDQGIAEIPDTILNSYRDARVKSELMRETNEKCAYCESKLTHISHGDVEHILPKVRFPRLRLEYANLTIACTKCNGAKGDYHEAQVPLLNPYEDDIPNHLFVTGTFIFGRPGSTPGRITEIKTDLNRPQLLLSRAEKIKSIRELAESLAIATNAVIRDELRTRLESAVKADAEYSFIVRGFYEASGVAAFMT